MSNYDPEVYWSRVAQAVAQRGPNVVAGDDNPFYVYKRSKFLSQLLDTTDFRGRTVLELGCGPGGNLKHILLEHEPQHIIGVDIAQPMLELARRNLDGLYKFELKKLVDGRIPVDDRSVDACLTVTVLQHNVDPESFSVLVSELCRASAGEVIVVEDIGRGNRIGSNGSFVGRDVATYKAEFAVHGFELIELKFLNTRASRLWHRLIFGFYKLVIARHHKEGDPLGSLTKTLIAAPLPLTRILDDVFVETKNLAKMVLRRSNTPDRAV